VVIDPAQIEFGHENHSEEKDFVVLIWAKVKTSAIAYSSSVSTRFQYSTTPLLLMIQNYKVTTWPLLNAAIIP